MESIFDMDDKSLKRLQNFMKNAPNEFRRATAGVLNNLAFQTRQNDVENITSKMVIRNRAFVERQLTYTKAKAGRIETQVSYAQSIERENFTGWKEQETGERPKKERAATIQARRGSYRNIQSKRSRLLRGNQYYKSEQFQGKTYQSKFQFMLRVLGSRGGGQFILTEKYQTKNGGIMGPGLYEISRRPKSKDGTTYKGKNIKRLQKFGDIKQPARFHWRRLSITQLQNRNNIKTIWAREINRVLNSYK